MNQIATIPSNITSYSDLNPPPGTAYYQVAVVNEKGCNPTKKSGEYDMSVSNIEDFTDSTSIEVDEISIVPNPIVGESVFSFPNPDGKPFKFSLYDVTGKEHIRNISVNSNSFLLRKGTIQRGLYFYKLEGDKIYKGKIVFH
jgi:hypothetical protein